MVSMSVVRVVMLVTVDSPKRCSYTVLLLHPAAVVAVAVAAVVVVVVAVAAAAVVAITVDEDISRYCVTRCTWTISSRNLLALMIYYHGYSKMSQTQHTHTYTYTCM